METMMVVYCDACGQRVQAKDHEKVDVLKRRYDCHRGECRNTFNEFKMRVERIAASQVSNLRSLIDAEEAAFWKDRNQVGIPEEATR